MDEDAEAPPFLLRFWGREHDLAVETLRAAGLLEDTRDEDGSATAAWYETAEERDRAQAMLLSLKGPDGACGLMTDGEHSGPDTRLVTVARVHLRHGSREFHFEDSSYGYGYPPSSAAFMWEDGNYACDDNRSSFIRRHCDPAFPEFGCGNEIELVGVEVVRRQVPVATVQ